MRTQLITAHLRANLQTIFRRKGYVISTMLMPSLFFLFFGLPNAHNGIVAAYLAASFATFAAFGIVFFQFAVGIATERELPWSRYLRALPITPSVMFTARSLSALLMALLASTLVLMIAVATAHIELTLDQWLRLYAGILGGAVPCALAGIALGYWVDPRNALPVANIFYLLMSLAGGLWMPSSMLPSFIQPIAAYLPTYRWANIVHAAALNQAWHVADWLWILAFVGIFGALSAWGFRRDEAIRYA